MKILYYKRGRPEQIHWELTESELSNIVEILNNQRSGHIEFRGQSLKVVDIEVLDKVGDDDGKRYVTDFTTDEIKNTLGDFEYKRKMALMELVMDKNGVNLDMISKMSVQERNGQYVKISDSPSEVLEMVRKKMGMEYVEYQTKESMISELNYRRQKAQDIENSAMDDLVN